jgi:transaldolase / glucose-6-phosphate isomerase
MNRMAVQLGPLADRVDKAIEVAVTNDIVKRIWRKDPSVWKSGDDSAGMIRNSLGWLTVADEMIDVVDELSQFADLIRNEGFRHVMVCGMGGSSLCPEVLARTFGHQDGFPELLVLDSTDPDVIAAFKERIDIEHCLFIISSKSGSTTEPNVFYKFWYDEVRQRRENPGENFIAITDPGSPLVETAAELGFRKTFLNQADIGGRYSALSYFGMVPAALMGLDIRKFLERAREATSGENTALELGTILGECANAGRDKLTLVIDPSLETLGLWIEQLIAESTGKEGKGILPVNGETLGHPDVYGNDRLFVSISAGAASEATKAKLDTLAAAGHPIIYRELADSYDLGAEFFVWEFATACAGWRLGINPFDQPNVQEAKDATKDLLSTFERRGHLPERSDLAADDFIAIYGEETEETEETKSVAEVLRAHLATIKPGDYIAFLNYIEETPEIDRMFQELRTKLRDATKCAVTIGYGPRFLHSTGQLHKGGPDTGVFFQIIANDESDFAVPGEPYTFSILKQAQALGDFRALAKRGRRVIGIDFGNNTLSGLAQLLNYNPQITQILFKKSV